MCRVEQESSMHGTPDASFVTARTVRSPGQSQSSSQSAWGRGARARLLAPVQSASPLIDHQARSACCWTRKLPAPRAKLLEPVQMAPLLIEHHVKLGKVLSCVTGAQLRLHCQLRHA